MPDEWEADIKLIREVLESRSVVGSGPFPGPRLIGWHEALEALERISQHMKRLKQKEADARN